MENVGDGHEQTTAERKLLREGHRFPWAEAMTTSRWNRWVWTAWLVLKIALAVLAVVLIGVGIKALVDRQEAMEASEIIALTAVLVTGVGAVFTVAVNAWLGRKRLAGEERRHIERLATDERMHDARLEHEAGVHTKRLAHERREAQRTTAARAYSLAGDGLRAVNPSALSRLEARSPERVAEIGKIVEAALELELIEALGWDEDVRETAMELGAGLAQLAEVADRVSQGLHDDILDDPEAARQEFNLVWGDAYEAWGAYRKAIVA